MVAAIIRDLQDGVVSILHVSSMASFIMDRTSRMDHAFIIGSQDTSRKNTPI